MDMRVINRVGEIASHSVGKYLQRVTLVHQHIELFMHLSRDLFMMY